MNWRSWVWERLEGDAPLITVIPSTSHFAAGSLKKAPEKRPWLIIKLTEDSPGSISRSRLQGAEVWVYDEPGSYQKIDAALKLVEAALISAIPGGNGICAEWQGNSSELADDFFGAITRFASFRLVGSGREG